jgi:hypothetical protein
VFKLTAAREDGSMLTISTDDDVCQMVLIGVVDEAIGMVRDPETVFEGGLSAEREVKPGKDFLWGLLHHRKIAKT